MFNLYFSRIVSEENFNIFVLRYLGIRELSREDKWQEARGNKNQSETEEIDGLGRMWSKEVESTGKNRMDKITRDYMGS